MSRIEVISAPQEQLHFVPWVPQTVVSQEMRDQFVELRKLLRAAVEKFFMDELNADSALHLQSDEPLLVEQSAEIDGFANPLVCQIDKSSLALVCATIFGGVSEEARHGPLHESPMLAALTMHIQDALIDRFCKAASECKGMDFKRAACDQRRRPIPSDNASDVEVFNVDVKGCAFSVTFRLSKPDAARLAAASVARDETIDPGGQETQVIRAIEQAEVTLEAVLDDRLATLEELRDWKPGSLVRLASTPRSIALIVVQGEVLFGCEIVRHDEFFALRVNGAVGADEEQTVEHE